MNGNTKLIEYGIQTDKSDFRAHVCVNAKTVYVFPTKNALERVKTGLYPCKPVYTNGIHTANGYTVPPDDIFQINEIKIPDKWLEIVNFSNNDSTSIKGEKAIRIVKNLLKAGKFPIITNGIEIDDTDMQISGFDITVNLSINIQVKCDFRGGGNKKDFINDTTGNLYLQTEECNPFKLH